ncbi:MAG: DNA repair exonuclease [Ectothiorhodospiraceae bacterium]|nr:DNA repair exonuclease [Chromatiales bacterium]MCP5157607.1 DNA repair exonuclease [Ectothiorhodospiraceae bacterium]
MKVLHAADIHLDSPLRGLSDYDGAPVEEIRGATRRAFGAMVDLAIEESVGLVLVAGDLYDGDWRDYNTGLYFVRETARLADAGIPTVVVAGNHDAASQLTRSLRLPSAVRLLAHQAPETMVLDALGIAVHGQSFAARVVSEDLSAGYPAPVPGALNIGLLHTSLDGRPGHEPYAPCTVEGLRRRGYGYWALGHVHRREVVSQEPWIVFPGNLQGRHARETGAKGCTLIEVAGDEVVGVEHRALDAVRWAACEVDAAECRDLDAVLDRMERVIVGARAEADDRTLALRLRVHGQCTADRRLRAHPQHLVSESRALGNAVGGGRVWIERVLIDTSSPAAAGARHDALGGLLDRLAAAGDSPQRLIELTDGLAELRGKLPRELLDGPEAVDPTDPAWIGSRLADVRALLLQRLLEAEGER